MEHGTPEYRDNVRDVLAMLEAVLEIQGGLPASGMDPRENLTLLLEHADTDNCLQIALSLLGSCWMVVCHVKASALGTTPDQEMTDIFASFRELLA